MNVRGIYPAELYCKFSVSLFIGHFDQPLDLVDLYRILYPFALEDILLTKMGDAILPDASICFLSRMEPPPTETALLERKLTVLLTGKGVIKTNAGNPRTHGYCLCLKPTED